MWTFSHHMKALMQSFFRTPANQTVSSAGASVALTGQGCTRQSAFMSMGIAECGSASSGISTHLKPVGGAPGFIGAVTDLDKAGFLRRSSYCSMPSLIAALNSAYVAQQVQIAPMRVNASHEMAITPSADCIEVPPLKSGNFRTRSSWIHVLDAAAHLVRSSSAAPGGAPACGEVLGAELVRSTPDGNHGDNNGVQP